MATMKKTAKAAAPTHDVARDQALVRMTQLMAHMQIPTNGTEAIELAKFYMENDDAEALISRAAKIAKMKGVLVNGSEIVRMAKFIA